MNETLRNVKDTKNKATEALSYKLSSRALIAEKCYSWKPEKMLEKYCDDAEFSFIDRVSFDDVRQDIVGKCLDKFLNNELTNVSSLYLGKYNNSDESVNRKLSEFIRRFGHNIAYIYT